MILVSLIIALTSRCYLVGKLKNFHNQYLKNFGALPASAISVAPPLQVAPFNFWPGSPLQSKSKNSGWLSISTTEYHGLILNQVLLMCQQISCITNSLASKKEKLAAFQAILEVIFTKFSRGASLDHLDVCTSRACGWLPPAFTVHNQLMVHRNV